MNEDLYYLLAYTLIVVLCSFLVYCGYSLKRELKHRSEERTNNRRAFYRDKAYKDLAEKRTLKNSRQALWNALRK